MQDEFTPVKSVTGYNVGGDIAVAVRLNNLLPFVFERVARQNGQVHIKRSWVLD